MMDSSIVPEEFLTHIGNDEVETASVGRYPSHGYIVSIAVISATVS